MAAFMCCIWWFLLGLLLGWLLHWLLSKSTRSSDPNSSGPGGAHSDQHASTYSANRVTPQASAKSSDAALGSTSTASPAAGVSTLVGAATVATSAVVATAKPAIDFAAASAHGFSVKGEDDLQVVEGIGPKIKGILNAQGIATFKQLSETPVATIQTYLDAAGPRYKLAVPQSWPEQARLAASNKWQALKVLQDSLDAGVDRSSSDN